MIWAAGGAAHLFIYSSVILEITTVNRYTLVIYYSGVDVDTIGQDDFDDDSSVGRLLDSGRDPISVF